MTKPWGYRDIALGKVCEGIYCSILLFAGDFFVSVLLLLS